MGKTLGLLSFVIYLLITIGLFYVIPNGVLLTIATLPYILWWIGFKTKAHYLLIPLVLFLFAFLFIVLPIIDLTGGHIAFFSNMYDLIYPSGFSYAWYQQTPAIIMISISLTVSFILFVKLMLWIIKNINRKISKFNWVLALSQFLIWILFIYTIMNLIPALLGEGILESYREFFAVSIFYDIFFVWIPFLVIYFLIEYLIDRWVFGKGYD